MSSALQSADKFLFLLRGYSSENGIPFRRSPQKFGCVKRCGVNKVFRAVYTRLFRYFGNRGGVIARYDFYLHSLLFEIAESFFRIFSYRV